MLIFRERAENGCFWSFDEAASRHVFMPGLSMTNTFLRISEYASELKEQEAGISILIHFEGFCQVVHGFVTTTYEYIAVICNLLINR